MPVVLREYGLRYIIYLDDHPPPHIHVEGKGGSANIAIDGPELVWSRGLGRTDVNFALDAVRRNGVDFATAWKNIHG